MTDIDDERERHRPILAGLWLLGALSHAPLGRPGALETASANLRAMTAQPEHRAERAARRLLTAKIETLDDETAEACGEAAEYGDACLAWRGLRPYHDAEAQPGLQGVRSIDRFLLGPLELSGLGVDDLAGRLMRREVGPTMLDLMLSLGAVELMSDDDFLGYLDEVVEAIRTR